VEDTNELVNAETYFDEHLRVGDYYSQNDQTLGQWQGLAAKRLGLQNTVKRDDFLQLCRNLNPATGERLTQRLKTTRVDSGHEVANRRIFYDFTFSPPKSVSLLALVAQDQRLIESHDRAVVSALAELEQFAATRVHEAGQISDRLTATLSPPRSATTHHAPWTRICTPTAFCLTPLMMTWKAVGRRWTTLKCSRPRNSWRMYITMNSSRP